MNLVINQSLTRLYCTVLNFEAFTRGRSYHAKIMCPSTNDTRTVLRLLRVPVTLLAVCLHRSPICQSTYEYSHAVGGSEHFFFQHDWARPTCRLAGRSSLNCTPFKELYEYCIQITIHTQNFDIIQTY